MLLTSPFGRIETQDLMLSEYLVEKIIEVGPTDTLTNMAKRTRDLKYRQHDAANSIQRSFFSSKRDKCQIYHTADEGRKASENPSIAPLPAAGSQITAIPSARKTPDSEPMKLVPSAQMPTTAIMPQSDPVQMVPLVPAATLSTVSVVKTVPDVPVRATEIVRTIVACSLKKDPKELTFSSTIKGLAGGQSFGAHCRKRKSTDEHPRQIHHSKRDCW